MSTQAQFDAAVSIVKSINDGPYEASEKVIGKFQALYNQCTIGPLDPNEYKAAIAKDSFSACMYESWFSLGNISKEKAMKLYVEDLKVIVETLSFTDKVANFLSLISPFYEFLDDEEEGVSGDESENSARSSHKTIATTQSRLKVCSETESNASCITTKEDEELYLDLQDYKDFETIESLSLSPEVSLHNLSNKIIDMSTRLERIESLLSKLTLQSSTRKSIWSWIPFNELSIQTTLFMLSFPLLFQLSVYTLQKTTN